MRSANLTIKSAQSRHHKTAYCKIKELMHRIIASSLLFIICVSVTSCTHKTAEKTFFAMDTVMTVKAACDEKYLDDIEVLVSDIENSLSVTLPDSTISRLNRDKSVNLNTDTTGLINRALELCEQTGGCLDISVYPVLKMWGFTTGKYSIPSEDDITKALSDVDHKQICLSEKEISLSGNMEIDLGSVAKGYTGDRIIELLREKGVKNALLSLGGNIQALGSRTDGKPWKVAVNAPNKEGYALTLEISDSCVITSGGYERYFEKDGVRYIHIIDPHTGYPVNNGLASVTVVGRSGLDCDAYSTALFVMGLDEGIEFWRNKLNDPADPVELIFITEDDRIFITEGLKDRYTLTENYSESALTIIHK